MLRSLVGSEMCIRDRYGSNLTAPHSSSSKPENLLVFDQSKYWVNASHPELKSPHLPSDGSAGLAGQAKAYVPQRCLATSKAPPGLKCRMHLYHHGCAGGWDSVFYNGATQHSGFNEWAEENDIIVIYPAMSSWGVTEQSLSGCWDGYGQTGSDYSLKSGAQISVIRQMVAELAAV
eukprot:TRINITY_DN9376_c0_g1_i4.p1 TRINITY_DN9376_c0_g1~~TRINITY_DN9376_c0_g1_i4.p1  ORF type:complete len:201 (+),score=55.73 TRINITY_DN9376_c0_g1_i4:76-603(+)